MQYTRLMTSTIHYTVNKCALGLMLVAASDTGICAITLGDDAKALVRDLQDRFPKAKLIDDKRKLERLTSEVVSLVSHPGTHRNLPLNIRGTAFQQRVWKELCAIPCGRTASYAEIAKRVGKPRAVRAVAQACAANPLAIAIPCHRVVRADGSLSGYRWGAERKRELLARERSIH